MEGNPEKKRLTPAEWVLLWGGRLIIHICYRIPYPFLPEIARGLEVPLREAGFIVAVRSFMALGAAGVGYWGQRAGYFRWMLGAILLMIAGCLVISGSSGLWLAALGFACTGLAQMAFSPAVQAYVSESVPYSQRGRAIGVAESTWAGSWFIGIPLAGILIARLGWRSPFLIIAVLGVLLAILAYKIRDRLDGRRTPPMAGDSPAGSTTGSYRQTLLKAAPVLAMSFFMVLGNETMMIVYGAWLEKSFHFKVESLGLFSAMFGFAELFGELMVATIADRLGKRRCILVGLCALAIAYPLLYRCGGSIPAAMAGLITVFFFFEFAIVSTFTFVSEFAPGERGQMLAANYSFAVGGRLVGALIGPWLWEMGGGLFYNGLSAGGCGLLAILLLFRAAGRGGWSD